VFRTAGPPVKRDASFETTLAENQARGTEGSNPLPSSAESCANLQPTSFCGGHFTRDGLDLRLSIFLGGGAGLYGHWENGKNPPTPEGWLTTATAQPNSWWPTWESWISQCAGGDVPARYPGDGKLKPLEDAPGSYVKVRAAD